jgi:hypothetical protein
MPAHDSTELRALLRDAQSRCGTDALRRSYLRRNGLVEAEIAVACAAFELLDKVEERIDAARLEGYEDGRDSLRDHLYAVLP